VKWVLRVETTDREHSHIDVANPDDAAIVINEINDAREAEGKGPARTSLDSYETEWTCLACGERRFNTEADSVTETTA
jgi:hypothetical protein